MNTREDRAGTRDEKENKKDTKNEPNEKKKHRIPAGLALMHGFSSTNVGKSRLTVRKSHPWSGFILANLAQMEPPPNFGVFNKGKASVKIKVDESKRTKQRGISDSDVWNTELSLTGFVDEAFLFASSLKIDFSTLDLRSHRESVSFLKRRQTLTAAMSLHLWSKLGIQLQFNSRNQSRRNPLDDASVLLLCSVIVRRLTVMQAGLLVCGKPSRPTRLSQWHQDHQHIRPLGLLNKMVTACLARLLISPSPL